MQLIYFLPDESAGISSVIANLLKYRSNRKIKTKIVLTRLREKNSQNVKFNFDADEQVVFHYSQSENLYSVVTRLKEHVTSEKSIIVANDNLELRMVNMLKLKNPVTYIVHGDFKFYYKLVTLYQNIIDQYIAISNIIYSNILIKLDKPNKHKAKLLYFSVPEVHIENKFTKSNELLFVGEISKRKGVQFIRDIYEKVIANFPDTSLRIVGRGRKELELKDQLNGFEQIDFIGQLDHKDVINEMINSKILLFPSLKEGLPNVVVEAMKSQCLPICHNLESGISDLIDDKINGFLVPKGDVQTFADRIIYLLKNENIRERMATDGLLKANSMFNAVENARNYEEAILATTPSQKLYHKKELGGILNKPFLPNGIVKIIRNLKISKKL